MPEIGTYSKRPLPSLFAPEPVSSRAMPAMETGAAIQEQPVAQELDAITKLTTLQEVPPSQAMENGVIMPENRAREGTISGVCGAFSVRRCQTIPREADMRNAALARDSLPLVCLPA